MKQRKKTKGRSALLYTDDNKDRFEARLRKNAKTGEPRVPAMLASAGKRSRFTGMTVKGTIAALREADGKQKKPKK